MTNTIEIKVPDIGSFKNVPIIELCVLPGASVKAEDALLTLESDKATIDIPSPVDGVVQSFSVKVGDKISEGDLVAILEIAAPSAIAASAPSAELAAAPVQSSAAQSEVDTDCDVLVLGAGPGGYSAAFRAADLGLKTILVERYDSLGGVCLNVGCIPSKALLHVALVMDEAAHLDACGIHFGAPNIDLDALREHKNKIVGKLTSGLAAMAKMRQVKVVRGYGRFLDAQQIEVDLTAAGVSTGSKQILRFKKCIIAAGSAAVHLPFLPQDPRIVDSTGALELRFVPQKMLVIGGGIIGLEMATVYALLGAQIDIVEMLDDLMQGPDRDAVKVWEKQNLHRFNKVMRSTKTISVDAKDDGLYVKFAAVGADLGADSANLPTEAVRYDLILQAAGRAPNGKKIAAENAGINVSERGFIPTDKEMRTNIPHIFAIGDIVGNPMLAHKGVHEGHVAAEVAAGQKSGFDTTVIPSVAYTHPEVAWVGLTEEQAAKEGRAIDVGKFPWAASGRALANGADYGFTKLIFDADTQRIIGGAIVGPSAGDMIGEIALAIEMGCDATDIGKTIHPHPTLGETIGLAAEVAHGTCTDLPPRKK